MDSVTWRLWRNKIEYMADHRRCPDVVVRGLPLLTSHVGKDAKNSVICLVLAHICLIKKNLEFKTEKSIIHKRAVEK